MRGVAVACLFAVLGACSQAAPAAAPSPDPTTPSPSLLVPATAAPTTAAPAPTSAPGAVTIEMGDHFFAPKELTIAVGTTVTWRLVGQAAHDIKASDGSFVAANLLPGDTFSHTFTRAGRFEYVCGQHEGDGMVGVITVN